MSGSEFQATQEALDEAIAEAKEANMEVVRSTPTTLLLDLDTKEACKQFEVMFRFLNDLLGASVLDMWDSKSGEGTHVLLEMGFEMDIPTRVALQCALGSDPWREVGAIACLQNGVKDPIVLFRPDTEERFMDRLKEKTGHMDPLPGAIGAL